MSDFENIVAFLRLQRRSEEAEKNALPPTEVLLTSLEGNESYNVSKAIFETDFIKYKRIFNILEDHNAESIYLLKNATERKYFVKKADGKYYNLLDESTVVLNEEWLIEFPIESATHSYIYDTEKNIIVTLSTTLQEVIIFPDFIYYYPRGRYITDIESITYTYDHEDHVTTFGKILKVLFEDESYLWSNPEKKVQVIKSEKEGNINLIPFLQVEHGFGNFILKYRYYEKGYRPRFFLQDDQCALVLKFKGIGGLLTFLDQTLFSEGFSLEKGENENALRDYFRDQFMDQIIHAIENNLKKKGTFSYQDAMETLFYLPESVAITFSDDFLWMLLEMAINRDSLTNKTNLAEENIFVKLIRVILQKEGREVKLMNWFLEKIKDGDKNITKFEFIYDRINGDNFIKFVELINQAWKKSRFIYPDTENNPEFDTTDGLLFLPYSSEKTLGFYFSNVSMSFETHHQKERLIKTWYETGKTQKVDKVNPKTGDIYQVDEEIVDQFWYHPFYPIYLKDIEKQEMDMKLDSIVPAFMLKANRDKQFWSNVVITAEYAADILATVSGVGNIAKFRYLAKFATKASKLRFVSKAGRTVVAARKAVAATAAAVEITSGTVNALLKLTGARDTEWGKSLSEYLFWLELLSLSGELTVAIHNGLRKSAKKLVEKPEDAAELEKQLDDLVEEGKIARKEADEVIDELKAVAELERKLGDLIIHSGDDISESLVKSIIKQVQETTGLKNFEINLVDRNNEKYRKLFEQWQKGGGYGFFKPTSGPIRTYKGIPGEGPQIYMFAGKTVDEWGNARYVEFTKYTLQHELFHTEMFIYLKNKTSNYMKYWNDIPNYMHEQYVLNRLLKTKNWKQADLEIDLRNINTTRIGLDLPEISLNELKNWKFEIELEKIGIKIK